MRLNATPLLPLVLLSSAHPQATQEVESPRTTVSAGSSCAEADLDAELESNLAADSGDLQVVVAAGPNRLYNLPSAVRLVNQASATSRRVSLVLRVDEGEVPTPLMFEEKRIDSTDDRWSSIVDDLEGGVATQLQGVDSSVTQSLQVQPMGTSYTEVADSIAETTANHLVFLAHNTPLQWRLELAAENTVAAGHTPENLNSIQVLCHDGSPLPGDADKEIFSYLADRVESVCAGHDFVMDTSRGGHRLGKVKEKLGIQ